MDIYVFVYGTLREGEINDARLLAARLGLPAPEPMGRARVRGRLYDFGDWPGLVEAADGPAVLGEVYRIGPALLAAMDEVEEYVPGQDTLFVRRRVELDLGGRPLSCFFYPIDPRQTGAAVPIDHDDWIAYRRARQGAATGGAVG
ncbi:gamma-glutamylcyclotransferase [Pigmentiphaga soli]|uniref:Gamma-glutamylcyclotransferase n=1 Tax=Pigmentiphaga soli TaxID=1007095 RepID=A0ABP8HDR8_9BURK